MILTFTKSAESIEVELNRYIPLEDINELNAEHKFRVWVTILGPTSLQKFKFKYICNHIYIYIIATTHNNNHYTHSTQK